MKSYRADGPAVSQWRRDGAACGRVPHATGVIVARGCDECAVATEIRVHDRIKVHERIANGRATAGIGEQRLLRAVVEGQLVAAIRADSNTDRITRLACVGWLNSSLAMSMGEV
jgi:hypothetical protein